MEPERFDEVERELDLFRKLLELGHQTEVEPFLDEALKLVAEIRAAFSSGLIAEALGDGHDDHRCFGAR